MENQNYLQYPEMMSGKKILYVHGFASSGASGTVKSLRILLPNAEIIAPDLPISPLKSMELLHKICDEQKPEIRSHIHFYRAPADCFFRRGADRGTSSRGFCFPVSL